MSILPQLERDLLAAARARADRRFERRGADTPAAVPDPAIAKLWKRYGTSGDHGASRQLLIHYAPIVEQAVAGMPRSAWPAGASRQRLLAHGFAGLEQAIEQFDPSQGIEFKSYAMLAIRRELESYGEGIEPDRLRETSKRPGRPSAVREDRTRSRSDPGTRR